MSPFHKNYVNFAFDLIKVYEEQFNAARRSRQELFNSIIYLNLDHTVCVNLFIGWAFTVARKEIGSRGFNAFIFCTNKNAV